MAKKVKHRAAKDLANKIYQAVKLVPADDSGLNKHAVWVARELMRTVSLEHDCTPQEVMAFSAILAGVHERKLRLAGGGGPGVGVVAVDVCEGKFLRAV